MGKIVKYCGACEESFAQKFGFCPNCGGALKAFEMNPVQDEVKVAPAEKLTEMTPLSESPKTSQPEANNFAAPTVPPTKIYDISPPAKAPNAQAATVFPINSASSNGVKANSVQTSAEPTVSDKSLVNAKISEIPAAKNPTVEAKPLAAVAPKSNGNGNGNGRKPQAADGVYQATHNSQINRANDGFHVTVIEEKNGGQRNVLLLGSMFLMISLAVGGFMYSLFNKDALVGSIEGGDLFAAVPIVAEEPMEVEKELPKPKIDKDAGGGGGGGREEQTPTSKGRLATQMPDPPLITPSKTIVQLTNPTIKIQATTQGTKQIKPTDEPYGDPNSKYTLSSDGMGSGRGQGSGQGTGQGSGRGTGAGTGIGSGFGGGLGDGTGNGTGSGTAGVRNPPPPPPSRPPEPVGPTTGVNIISKPRPGYTDAARQAQVTGTVTLRVTFTANGTIGSISPVSGLPNGLTEQAIASARLIKFEPAKKGGVPVTVTKQVQYSFTIY